MSPPLSSRLSVMLCIATLLLAGCDREAADGAQQQGELGASKADLGDATAGEVDRSHSGELMPAVEIALPDGTRLNTGAIQGQPVLVNLWATWCAPCVKELPLLDDLAADYADDLRVLAVSQDLQGADKVVPFFEQAGYAQLQPWLDPENALGFALGGSGLPVTVMYDASGTEIWRISGDYDWSSPAARALVDEGLGG